MQSPRTSSLLHASSVLAGAALLALVGARPLWHDDLFFHLRTGEVVAETGVVPRSDPFTHTVAGTPWTSHEWGFGLVLHAGYALGDFQALLFYLPLVLLAVFGAVYVQMRRELSAERRWLSVPLLLLGIGGGQVSCFVLRAALVTTLGLALVGGLLQRDRLRPTPWKLAAVALVVLVWANMHAGAVFGLLTIGLYWLQAIYDARPASLRALPGILARGAPLRYAALLLGCAALTLVNPSGIELWTFPFRVNALFFQNEIAWSMGQYRAPRLGLYPWFFLLVVAVLAACLPVGRLADVARARRAPLLAQGLGTAFFLVMALRANRFILDFVVFAAPFCAMRWGGLDTKRAATEPGWSARLAPALHAAALALVVLVFVVVAPRPPARVLDARIQVCLADFMERERIAGRMFNDEASGGYLGWRLRQPVYWDGRNDIFGPLAREFAYAQSLGELVERHRLDMLVLNPGYQRRFRSELGPASDFALVYFDDHSALYLKRDERFAPVVARWEYRLLQPFGVPGASEREKLARSAELRRAFAREVDRVRGQCAQSYTARRLAAMVERTST